MNDATTLINNIVNQYIVKPTGGLLSQGINGFVFDIISDEDLSLNSDITDHFVEDLTAVQDHIALRPPEFSLIGFVAELKDVFQFSVSNISNIVKTLNLVGEYSQTFTTQAQQVYNVLTGQASPNSQYNNIYQLFNEVSTSATSQQNAYSFFINLWQSRTLCTVETPWDVWQNMAIKSVRILQRDDNRFVSEFSVTFKQMRMVSTSSHKVANQAIQNSNFFGAFQQTYLDKALDMTSPSSLTGFSVSGQALLPSGQAVATDYLKQSFWGIAS